MHKIKKCCIINLYMYKTIRDLIRLFVRLLLLHMITPLLALLNGHIPGFGYDLYGTTTESRSDEWIHLCHVAAQPEEPTASSGEH